MSPVSRSVSRPVSRSILAGQSNTLASIIKSLFANNEQGFTRDPYDLSVMFQDAAGTIPVTAVGQAVGLMLDKSKGLVLGAELVTNGDFSNGTTGWESTAATLSASGGVCTVTAGAPGSIRVGRAIATEIGKTYKVTATIAVLSIVVDITARSGVSLGEMSSTQAVVTTTVSKTVTMYFRANNASTMVYFNMNASASGQQYQVSGISCKELAGKHAYQTTSAARPLLQDAPRRIDFDAVDDKLITNLPAQITGCTVIRSVPNVGTQILTGQTIPATYEDNKDHCGLIVINRALTATETSQITKLFNKAAGV